MNSRLISLIAPFPPPAGGVSEHALRLAQMLIADGSTVNFYDDSNISILPGFHPAEGRAVHQEEQTGQELSPVRLRQSWSLLWTLIFRDRKRTQIVHYHGKSWHIRALICIAQMFNRSLKTVFTVHSLREDSSQYRGLKGPLAKFVFSRGGHFIVTNSVIKETLVEAGLSEKKTSIIPAFLPSNGRALVQESKANNLSEFIGNRSPVLLTYASAVKFYNGSDLYGIDMSFDLLDRLIRDNPRIGLVFSMPSVKEGEYISGLLGKYPEDYFEHISLCFEDMDLVSIMKKADVFLRPTNSDGDSLSVREAIYCGCPVVASDASERPESAVIFRSRDMDDFYDKTREVLHNIEYYKKRLKTGQSKDYYEEIKKIYETVN